MNRLSRYEVIAVAWKMRLLFRTDAEYREAVGVSFETLTAKRDSDRDMEVYYSILNDRASERIDIGLDRLVEDYLSASDLYLSIDWGERSQMASRKRFCRMLFRIMTTKGSDLSNDEIFKFRIKEDDEKLLKTFFPDGTESTAAVDIGMIVLFTFGIVKPWVSAASRGRDVTGAMVSEMVSRMRSTVELLKDDAPRMGSTEKPLIFDEVLGFLDSYRPVMEVTDEFSPIGMIGAITDIIDICRRLNDAELKRVESEEAGGLIMRGIWVDDADNGRNRFWIFPDNLLMAFCYSREGAEWVLTPYIFLIRSDHHADYMDTFILTVSTGDLAYTLSPDRAMTLEELATGAIDYDFDESTEEISEVRFCEGMCDWPKWLNWKKMNRLSSEDERYRKFHDLVPDFYNPRSPYSLLLTNVAAELTDRANCLVGRDNKYLYVFDRPQDKFELKETQPDRFVYTVTGNEDVCDESLFNLKITEENPLYCLPLNMKERATLKGEFRYLADILADAAYITEAYVLHSRKIKESRLVFPAYGRSFSLNLDELAGLGVRKLTKPVWG